MLSNGLSFTVNLEKKASSEKLMVVVYVFMLNRPNASKEVSLCQDTTADATSVTKCYKKETNNLPVTVWCM